MKFSEVCQNYIKNLSEEKRRIVEDNIKKLKEHNPTLFNEKGLLVNRTLYYSCFCISIKDVIRKLRGEAVPLQVINRMNYNKPEKEGNCIIANGRVVLCYSLNNNSVHSPSILYSEKDIHDYTFFPGAFEYVTLIPFTRKSSDILPNPGMNQITFALSELLKENNYQNVVSERCVEGYFEDSQNLVFYVPIINRSYFKDNQRYISYEEFFDFLEKINNDDYFYEFFKPLADKYLSLPEGQKWEKKVFGE